MLGSVDRATWLAMANYLGSVSTTFLGAPLWLHLLKDDIAPSLDTVLDDTMIADFDGYAPSAIAAGVRATNYDGNSGDRLIVIPPAANANTFETTGLTHLPETVYGGVLSDSSTTIESPHGIAYFRLDEPVQLTEADQGLTIPLIRVHVLTSAISEL